MCGTGSKGEGHRGRLTRNRTRNLGGSPMTLEDKVHGFRLYALRRAEEPGNVSAACRELDISRTTFYRWKKRLVAYGADGLHP